MFFSSSNFGLINAVILLKMPSEWKLSWLFRGVVLYIKRERTRHLVGMYSKWCESGYHVVKMLVGHYANGEAEISSL